MNGKLVTLQKIRDSLKKTTEYSYSAESSIGKIDVYIYKGISRRMLVTIQDDIIELFLYRYQWNRDSTYMAQSLEWPYVFEHVDLCLDKIDAILVIDSLTSK